MTCLLLVTKSFIGHFNQHSIPVYVCIFFPFKVSGASKMCIAIVEFIANCQVKLKQIYFEMSKKLNATVVEQIN